MKCRFITSLAIAALLTACASAPHAPPSASADTKPAATATASAAPQNLKQFTHADLLAAAKYAEDHGFPARAGMWRAIEAQLTAAEAQVAACKAAIEASLPKRSATDGTVGLAVLAEMGAEAVANAGVPAAVKVNCEPIVIPTNLLPIPKL